MTDTEIKDELTAALDGLLDFVWQMEWRYPDVPAVRSAIAAMAKVRGDDPEEAVRSIPGAAYKRPEDTRTPAQQEADDKRFMEIMLDIGNALGMSRDLMIKQLCDASLYN